MLITHGIEPKDFNSYGARRGNHEVMVRGTFANVRLRNQLVPGVEGGVTRYLPAQRADVDLRCGDEISSAEGTPLIVLAGKEYGSGSSRDWAAKGPYLLGVKAVIAESFERIHRSNLIGMGILPLEFDAGANRSTLRLDRRRDRSAITGIAAGITPRMHARRHGDRRANGEVDGVQSTRAHRHARRSRILSSRRHPAVRAEATAREFEKLRREG